VGGINTNDGDERQAKVANPLEQAMQSRLVLRDAAQRRCPIAFMGKGGHIQSGRPTGIKVTPKTNLIGPARVPIWW
jgi:hypothetical protein